MKKRNKLLILFIIIGLFIFVACGTWEYMYPNYYYYPNRPVIVHPPKYHPHIHRPIYKPPMRRHGH